MPKKFYLAVFIDEVQHNDFITPELLKHIRDSKFVVADLTLHALYHDIPLDSHMQDRLKHLTEMGIVEHIGRSKYVLSRSLYSAVGKSGVHTRIVGLDRETNKELLLKHMRKKGKEGASFKEFQQVLPNLSRDQITVLLRGLRRENRAYCAGKTSASRWFAGSMPTTDIEV